MKYSLKEDWNRTKQDLRKYTTAALIGVMCGTGAYATLDNTLVKHRKPAIVKLDKQALTKEEKLLDKYTITMKDTFDTMTDYDIHHSKLSDQLYGVTFFFPWKKIEINNDFPKEDRIQTVIHEFIHTYAYKNNLKMDEEQTEALAQEIYKLYYSNQKK